MFRLQAPKAWAVLFVLLAAGSYGISAEPVADLLAPEPTEPKPRMSVSGGLVLPGGTFDIVADFQLDKTVKLYKDKLKFKWQKLTGAKLKKIILPEAKLATDPLTNRKVPVYTKAAKVVARFVATGRKGDEILVSGSLEHQSCTDKICFLPATEAFRFRLVTGQAGAARITTEPGEGSAELTPLDASGPGGDRSALWQIVFAFLIGVGLSYTPCVYPTIPIAAAVIGARKERGLASALGASLLYVLGLSVVYALVGVAVAKAGGGVRDVLGSPYVRVPISALFVFLAVVMFAGWNFALPSGYAAKLQSRLAGGKGALRTFALGAVSALVVGPCVTAPLFGLLTYVADKASSLLGFWMLFAVGWGMGIPIILFGTASGLLPKAGLWMEWFKKLLGFVLLWAALYFLWPSVLGDRAYQVAFAVLLVVGAFVLGGFHTLIRKSSLGGRLKNVLGLAALVYAVFLGFAAMQPVTENVFKAASTRDVDAALASGKPFVVDFYTPDCAACKQLDRDIFTRPQVLEAGKGVLTFKINAQQERPLAERYGIRGVPAVFFFGADGRKREDLSFVGSNISLEGFLKKLEDFKR